MTPEKECRESQTPLTEGAYRAVWRGSNLGAKRCSSPRFFARGAKDEGLPGVDQRAEAMPHASNAVRSFDSALQPRGVFGYIPPAFRSG